MILSKLALTFSAGASAGIVLFGSWLGRPAMQTSAHLHPRPIAARPAPSPDSMSPSERLEAARRLGEALENPAAIGEKGLEAARKLGGEDGVKLLKGARKRAKTPLGR